MRGFVGSFGRGFSASLGLLWRIVGLRDPLSALAFLFASAMYVFFKVSLGLFLVADAEYGFSFVSPPFSLLMASSDVVISYACIAALERLAPRRFLGAALAATLAGTAVFLVCNYSAYTYFKSFVTYGLIRFNGAGAGELFGYLFESVDGLFVGFGAAALALVAGFAVAARRVRAIERALRRVAMAAAIATAAAGASWAGLAQLGWDQTGRLVRDPLVDIVQSTVEGLVLERAAKGAGAAGSFAPPEALLFGRAPEALPAGFEAPRLAKPNVLVVLVESLPLFQTPLADPESPLGVVADLAPGSLVFGSYRTVFPATSRSLIAMHCAAYPDNGFDTISRYMTDFACAPLPAVLGRAGYRTGMFHASMLTYDNLDKTGMMRSYGVVEDYFTFKDRSASVGIADRAVEEEVVAERVLEFMRRGGDEPFFATYFVYWTHSPYAVPPGEARQPEGTPLERYRASLAYVNGVIARLFADMKSAGLWDDTIVVLTADHGEAFGLHPGVYNHSSHVYEDTIRIPLVVKVPGLDRGHAVARPGTNVDFAPTLLGLLGLEAPAAWEGQDLLSGAYRARPALVFSRSTALANGIVDGSYKYIRYLDGGGGEHFYDLEKDPFERVDLIAQRRAEADAYEAIIGPWLAREQARITARPKP